MAPGDAAREKRAVYQGKLSRTKSGLTKSDLMLNKHGKVVSRKQHAAGKRLYARGRAEGWLAKPFTRGAGGAGRRRPRARQMFTNQIDHAKHNGLAYHPGASLDHMQRTMPAPRQMMATTGGTYAF